MVIEIVCQRRACDRSGCEQLVHHQVLHWDHVGVRQVRPVEVRVVEIGPPEVRSADDRTTQTRLDEASAFEVGLFKRGESRFAERKLAPSKWARQSLASPSRLACERSAFCRWASERSRLVVAVGRRVPGNRNDCKAWELSGAKAAVGITMVITDGGYRGRGPGQPSPSRKRPGRTPGMEGGAQRLPTARSGLVSSTPSPA